MYVVMASDCVGSIVSYSNNSSVKIQLDVEKCSIQNLLYNKNFINNFEWTISPSYSTTSHTYIVNSNGYIYESAYSNLGSVRPVLNLDTNIELTGNGILSNPYRIK